MKKEDYSIDDFLDILECYRCMIFTIAARYFDRAIKNK